MIENRNESELEAHLRRVVKHSGNLSGLKCDRGNEKTGLRTVSNTDQIHNNTHISGHFIWFLSRKSQDFTKIQ